MKANEASLFVFIASIIVGILISLNISFSNKTSITFLDSKQYQNALNQKESLESEIGALSDQYNDYYSKLKQIQGLGLNNDKVLNTMKTELADNGYKIGLTPVHGPGIQIDITDAPSDIIDENENDLSQFYLFHDSDLANVINELKCAGAEAISVNGQRVWDRTGFLCGGLFIDINGVQCWAPFHIEAIGDKNVLKEYMFRDTGYIKNVSLGRSLQISYSLKDDIKMSGYSGSIKSQYATLFTGKK